MSDYGLYVYGIMHESDDNALAGIRGVDETHSLMAVSASGYHAIASPVNLLEFGTCEIRERMQNSDWVGSKGKRHTEIVQQLSGIGTLLPIKFCTVFTNADQLKNFLRTKVPHLQEAFACFQNTEEWMLKINRDRRNYSGENINQMVNDKITETMAAFWQELGSKVEKTKLKGNLIIPAKENEEKLLMKSALLIRKEEVEGVKIWLREQQKKLEPFSLIVELLGPQPFYNFVETFVS